MLADGTLQLLVPNATITMVRAVPSMCPEVPWQVIAMKALHDRIHEAVGERVFVWSGAFQPVCHICGEPGARQVGEDEWDILAKHDGYHEHEPGFADRSIQPLVFCPPVAFTGIRRARSWWLPRRITAMLLPSCVWSSSKSSGLTWSRSLLRSPRLLRTAQL